MEGYSTLSVSSECKKVQRAAWYFGTYSVRMQRMQTEVPIPCSSLTQSTLSVTRYSILGVNIPAIDLQGLSTWPIELTTIDTTYCVCHPAKLMNISRGIQKSLTRRSSSEILSSPLLSPASSAAQHARNVSFLQCKSAKHCFFYCG